MDVLLLGGKTGEKALDVCVLLEMQVELMVMDLGVEWDEPGMGCWCPQELLAHPAAVPAVAEQSWKGTAGICSFSAAQAVADPGAAGDRCWLCCSPGAPGLSKILFLQSPGASHCQDLLGRRGALSRSSMAGTSLSLCCWAPLQLLCKGRK